MDTVDSAVLATALVRNRTRQELETFMLQHLSSSEIIEKYHLEASVESIHLGRRVVVKDLVIRANAMTGSFSSLCEELVISILSYLTCNEIFAATMYVCKDWYAMRSCPRLWSNIVIVGDKKSELRGFKASGQNILKVLTSIPLKFMSALTLVYDPSRDAKSWRTFFRGLGEEKVKLKVLRLHDFKVSPFLFTYVISMS